MCDNCRIRVADHVALCTGEKIARTVFALRVGEPALVYRHRYTHGDNGYTHRVKADLTRASVYCGAGTDA